MADGMSDDPAVERAALDEGGLDPRIDKVARAIFAAEFPGVAFDEGYGPHWYEVARAALSALGPPADLPAPPGDTREESSDSARESEAAGAYEQGEVQRLREQVRCARAWFDQLADGSYGPEVAAFAKQVAPSLYVAAAPPGDLVGARRLIEMLRKEPYESPHRDGREWADVYFTYCVGGPRAGWEVEWTGFNLPGNPNVCETAPTLAEACQKVIDRIEASRADAALTSGADDDG